MIHAVNQSIEVLCLGLFGSILKRLFWNNILLLLLKIKENILRVFLMWIIFRVRNAGTFSLKIAVRF